MNGMRQYYWLSLFLLAGCGGTNTNDVTSPYNRAGGVDSPISPMAGSPAANEIVAVDAILNAEDLKDAKQASLAVDGLKKLSVPPKRVFIIAPTATQAEWLKKPLGDAKIPAIPVPGPDTKDWAKTLKTLGADKIYSNGPKVAGPNADLLASDQTKFSSTAVYDGIRFFFLNTDTPMKAAKPGSIPRLWFLARQSEMKENSAVVIGYRAMQSLGKDDTTPVVSTTDYLAKAPKIKLYVSSSSKSPNLARPEGNPNYFMAVGGAVGEDKLPHIGLIEVRKNGAIYSKILKLDVTKAPTPKSEATLFEPTVMAKVDPKKDPTKDAAKDATKDPVKDAPKDSGNTTGGN